MRKLLSYFLVFTLIVTTVGVINVGADEKELKWNGFIYQVHNDTVANNKHVLIEDYVGTEKQITIPKEIDGIAVTELAEKFTCTSDITSVKIMDTMLKPEGLTWCETLEKIFVEDNSIRYKVIDGILYNKKVTSLLCYPSAKQKREYIAPKTVTETYGLQQMLLKNKSLKDVTFTSVVPDCTNTNIENVKITGNISYIPEGSFRECKNLKTVVIGSKVDFIERDAFYGCVSLQSVKLSNNLRSIYSCAFGKTKIKKVKIPKSVDYIDYDVFPTKTKIMKPSYLRKTVNPWNKSQHCYKAYVIAKIKSGTKKYRASNVTKITTTNKKVKLKKGKTHKIKTRVFVSKIKKAGFIKNDILKFTSSNNKVAKVTQGGKIKALRKGRTTITVMMRTFEKKLHTTRKKYKIKVKVL
ncbi:MAG: leucine-rich repeat domain-containing protein [Eubacterium sp.]|nr:leucine-rich repeat domain-containing protein [Eubacterium sp.]